MAGALPSMVIRIAANLAELKKNLAEGGQVINVTTAGMAKLAASLDGNKLFQQAHNIVGAVHSIGGASKLTEAEQARLNVTLDKALEKYRALGIEAPAEMVKLEAATRQTQTATELFQERWIAFAAAAGVAWLSVKRVVGELQDWITEASEQEDATARLTAALIAQGTYTPALIQQYTDLADRLQTTTVHADELTAEMMALLVQVGHVMPEQMEGALQAAMDLSAGMRISLPEATMLLAKALGTGGESLGRLKGLLGDTTIAGKDMASVLAAIQEKFGGQAAAQAAAYAGQMTILSNRFNDMKEKAGLLLMSALLPLLDYFKALPDSVQNVILVAGLLLGVAVPLATAIAAIAATWALAIPVLAVAAPAAIAAVTGAFAAMVPFLGPAGIIAAGIIAWFQVFKNLDVFVWAAKASWGALAGVFTSSIAAITGAAQAIYEGVKGWLVDRFNAIVDAIQGKVDAVTGFFRGMYDAVVGHSYVPDMVDGIAAQMARLQSVMVAPAEAAATKTTAAMSQMAHAVAAAERAQTQRQGGSFTAPTIAVTDANRSNLETRLAQIEAGYRRFPGRQSGVNGPTGNLGSKDWAAMLREQIEYASLTAALSGAPGMVGGGSVSAGSPYMVGERGPELFVPGRAGTIVPNGGGGMSLTVHVDARESFFDTPASLQRLAQKVGAALVAEQRSHGRVAG